MRDRSSAHASWAFPFEHLEIVGEHAFIRSEEVDRVVHSPGLEREMLIMEYKQLPRADKWGYREENSLFISACSDEILPAVDAQEAYKSIELCEACYRSAANNGEQIKLPL